MNFTSTCRETVGIAAQRVSAEPNDRYNKGDWHIRPYQTDLSLFRPPVDIESILNGPNLAGWYNRCNRVDCK